jgi:hypothetical protein
MFYYLDKPETKTITGTTNELMDTNKENPWGIFEPRNTQKHEKGF